MAGNNREREVKFYVSNLSKYGQQILALGGQLKKERVHEVNLRLDTPDRLLSSSSQLLRLRKDVRNRVTYKGPGTIEDGVRSRVEIEFEVDNYDNARILFENLGYEVVMVYEKFRTTYALDDAEIVLDEMPYGFFIEIEAGNPGTIRSLAEKLDLIWEARIFDSYTVLFDFLKWTRGLQFRDLSFENFASFTISPQDLGIRYADTP